MARTRMQIKTLVNSYTGRGQEKASLIEMLCDEALNVALNHHPFKDARDFTNEFALTEGETSVSIASIANLVHVISATLHYTDNSHFSKLKLKNETWWAENVTDAEGRTPGWPENVLRRGNVLHFDRPLVAGLTLKPVVTTKQVFSSDSAECPISLLELFVTQYVTAFVFLAVTETEKYKFWFTLAHGMQYVYSGKPGGTLAAAINQDKRDIAEEYKAQRSNDNDNDNSGLAILNLLKDHDRYGEIDYWV